MFTYTAFEDFKIVAQGSIANVALLLKRKQKDSKGSPLIFSDQTGRQLDLDFSGTEKQVLERLKIYSTNDIATNTGAGRPKLGVIGREISLLPHHW